MFENSPFKKLAGPNLLTAAIPSNGPPETSAGEPKTKKEEALRAL
jgi:hypothetical protein